MLFPSMMSSNKERVEDFVVPSLSDSKSAVDSFVAFGLPTAGDVVAGF